MATPLDIDAQHERQGLSERNLSLALIGKYLILVVYGSWAAVVEVPTFAIIGSSLFALSWAAAVTLFAGLAAIGVARTWVTRETRLEKVSTFLFVITFVGYSAALIWRSATSNDWGAAPLSLIPLALVILPVVRYFSLVRRTAREDNRS